MKLVALKAFKYGGKRLKAGDEFDCTSNSRAVIAVGLAKVPDAPAPEVVEEKPKRTYARKTPAVEAPVVEEIAAVLEPEKKKPAAKRGWYSRKDMTAEE